MRRFIIIIALLMGLAIAFTGCKKASETSGGDELDTEDVAEEDEEDTEDSDEEEDDREASNPDEEVMDEDEDNTTVKNAGEFTCIVDVSDYWSSLYATNEKAVNEYEGLESLVVVTPGLCFVTGVQYDILNINNVDGRFDGELLLAGYEGFVDKNGSQLTFGYEDVLDEDGFTNTMKAGDKKVENGNCNLNNGYYYSNSYTERDGVIITRSTNEFQKESDGSMSALVMEGNTMDFRGNEALSTSYTFIRIGDGWMEYVYAKSEIGTSYEELHLKENMTKEAAVEMLEAAGATIDHTGGVKDGAFYID